MDKANDIPPAPVLPAQAIEYEPLFPKQNPPAMRSLMYGLAMFVPFITGLLAIREARRGFKTAAVNGIGRSMAEVGFLLGVVNLLVWTYATIAVPPEIAAMHAHAKRITCLMHMRDLAADVIKYSSVNKGWLPPTLSVNGIRAFSCPSVSGPSNYVYVIGGTRGPTTQPSSLVVMVYEPPGNHAHAVNFALADGHAEDISTSKAQKMIAELNAGFNPPRPEKLK